MYIVFVNLCFEHWCQHRGSNAHSLKSWVADEDRKVRILDGISFFCVSFSAISLLVG